MRKFILPILLVAVLSPLSSVSIRLDESLGRISSRDFSLDFSSLVFSFRGKYLSYGRLDSLSAYSTLFNPYRKYHYTGLSISDSENRGLRGFLFRYGRFSLAFSSEEAFSAALSYDGNFIDASLIHYSARKDAVRNIIHDYRREERKDVYSLLLRARYRQYADLMAVLSYSPLLGIDGFYRLSTTWKGLTVTLKYGSTFLSDNVMEFAVEARIRGKNLDFDYSLSYGSESIYTDYFRPYESLYRITLKAFGMRVGHETDFTFSRKAERSRLDTLFLSYGGVYASYDSWGRLFMRLRRLPFEMGIASDGPFFSIKINDSLEIGYEGKRLRLNLTLSF